MGTRPPEPVTMQRNENGVVSVETSDNFPTLRSNGAGGDQASKSVEKSLISDWEKGSAPSALKSRNSSGRERHRNRRTRIRVLARPFWTWILAFRTLVRYWLDRTVLMVAAS
jgi:hypothetical protein